MRLFVIAFQFLTIVPLPFQVRCEERDLGRSMALFPLVGLALGGMLAGVDFLFAGRVAAEVGDLLLVTLLSLITGALHLDGLADVCDGFAARGPKERFLAVMKDSRVGAVGVVGLILGIGLKYQAIHALSPALKWQTLLLFPMAARCAQVVTAVGARTARTEGLGAAFVNGVGPLQLMAALLLTGVAGCALLGPSWLALLLVLSLCTFGCRRYFEQRLDGVTGDIIGFVSELNEITALILIPVFCGRI
ncbi:adenosylcobinamide-GDP ribazoletransferase [Geobacter pelophilus]|uniref:Adenosylcobinamide-GDP ribazoletransferase n=1 Tax=Geoanaerobacter pelophilus TaxID=60036 RepID=A0AAW4L9R0_9BACT|nr:adenosylcobinamide-GDP ribazoletransferase [Geoanaerobacter pelophilus]MBT0663911.1 adenosylcobinamide-GDP ribazoletransferase [Geoanaerobacter pelophilus]